MGFKFYGIGLKGLEGLCWIELKILGFLFAFLWLAIVFENKIVEFIVAVVE